MTRTQLGESQTLWAGLSTLPLAADVAGATAGIAVARSLGFAADRAQVDLYRTDGTPATGTLTFGANPAATKIVTIGTTVYTFRVTASAAYDVKIGATASDSLDNLIAAVTAGTGSGTLYGTGTAAHPDVTAAAGAGDTMTTTALVDGAAGNAIVTTTNVGSGSWGAATLTGGEDAATANSTVTQPLTVWGYDGSIWLSHAVLTTANQVVTGLKGVSFPTTGLGIYTRVALSAGGATPTDSAQITARLRWINEF